MVFVLGGVKGCQKENVIGKRWFVCLWTKLQLDESWTTV